MTAPIIPPGTTITLNGEEWIVEAVGFTGGERYYWLMATSDGAVQMTPATLVEPHYESKDVEDRAN